MLLFLFRRRDHAWIPPSPPFPSGRKRPRFSYEALQIGCLVAVDLHTSIDTKPLLSSPYLGVARAAGSLSSDPLRFPLFPVRADVVGRAYFFWRRTKCFFFKQTLFSPPLRNFAFFPRPTGGVPFFFGRRDMLKFFSFSLLSSGHSR